LPVNYRMLSEEDALAGRARLHHVHALRPRYFSVGLKS